jgi:hypothetical protein
MTDIICYYPNPPRIAEKDWTEVLSQRPGGRVTVTYLKEGDDLRATEVDGIKALKTKNKSVDLQIEKDHSLGKILHIGVKPQTLVPNSSERKSYDPEGFEQGIEKVLAYSDIKRVAPEGYEAFDIHSKDDPSYVSSLIIKMLEL